MGSWPAFGTQKYHGSISYNHSVLATKQTLLSINLVNHALFRLISDYQFTGPEDRTLDKPKEPRCLET